MDDWASTADEGAKVHAKHEAIHLLLYPLVDLVKGKRKETIKHWEAITRVLEKIL